MGHSNTPLPDLDNRSEGGKRDNSSRPYKTPYELIVDCDSDDANASAEKSDSLPVFSPTSLPSTEVSLTTLPTMPAEQSQ